MDGNWIVEFYETESGEKPSLDFINTLEVKLRVKVFRDLELLENKGFRKKTQKTPPEEIQKAKKYREDYLRRNPVLGGTK